MTEKTPTAASLTRLALERIEDGGVDDARRLLAQALDDDPRYEPAWLWFAHIAEEPGERKFALQQAIVANPESTARAELARYARVEAVTPPELEEIGGPPLPPSIPPPGDHDGLQPRRSRNPWGMAALALVVIAAVVAGLFLYRQERPGDPIFVAIAAGMSGSGAATGAEMTHSAQLFFDRLNREGGINGHPVELLTFDDENSPERARDIANEIVADGRVMLVIGHATSSASLAAGPIYAAAGIPVITSTATADDVTAENPWYFRSVFNNSAQGFLIAAYLHGILGHDRVTIVAGSDDFGQSLASGVSEAFAGSDQDITQLTLDTGAGDLAAGIAATVAAVNAEQDPGIVVLALQADPAAQLLTALRIAGVAAPIIGGDSIGSNRFISDVASLTPGSAIGDMTDGIYAASPLFMDSLSSESLRWFRAYRAEFDEDPTWRGATTYNAAIAAANAFDAARVTGATGALAAERTATRDALAAINSPETAVTGLMGPLYFDAERTVPSTAVFGVARGDGYASAFEQLRPYTPPTGESRADAMRDGSALEFAGVTLARQRIVYTGININEIGELDTANPSFYADFFVWFNFTGDADAATILFVNAVDPETSLGDPIRATTNDGQTYQLYRVRGRFKAPLEFRDFPFDQQQLVISFQNAELASSELVYAVDPTFLELPVKSRLRSGANAAESINAIPSWEPIDMQLYQDTVGTTALLGDPEATDASGGVEFSVFTADVTITRDLGGFLLKNLLPLGLLAAITYVSLFFSHSQTGERVAFAVSAILTTAVLLTSVTGVLPQIGYTVAIEWGFYAFILLSAICIIFGLVGDWMYEQGRYQELRRLDRFSHIFYPAYIAVIVAVYVIRFNLL
ncbi:MAG: ABC transporter substrate-binding protein [Thermomicrobiales bacterium]